MLAAIAGSSCRGEPHPPSSGTSRIAEVATLSEIQSLGPVWLRLRLDLSHHRLLHLRMVTAGHFMTQVRLPPKPHPSIHAPAAGAVQAAR
jgi:hypothetical protein